MNHKKFDFGISFERENEFKKVLLIEKSGNKTVPVIRLIPPSTNELMKWYVFNEVRKSTREGAIEMTYEMEPDKMLMKILNRIENSNSK